MSTTPTYATVYAVYGQLFNLTGAIKSITTGNGYSGGLSGNVSAIVSKGDGTFVSTTNTPVEILGPASASTGVWSVDLTAQEMSYPKLYVIVSSSQPNTVWSYVEIRTLNLSKFTSRWDLQSPVRFEQIWMDDFILNGGYGVAQSGAQIQYFNEDGSLHFQGGVTQTETTGAKTIVE